MVQVAAAEINKAFVVLEAHLGFLKDALMMRE
jgi:hypothetical protein